MYIKTSPNSTSQQVTFNGEENKILNGIPDWVYEGKWKIYDSFTFSVCMRKLASYCYTSSCVLCLQEETLINSIRILIQTFEILISHVNKPFYINIRPYHMINTGT